MILVVSNRAPRPALLEGHRCGILRAWWTMRPEGIVTKNSSSMPTSNAKPRTGIGCFLTILGAFGLLVAVGILSNWASISGIEFSPNTFQTRSFAYSRIPGTQMRLSKTKLGTPSSPTSTDVLKHLPTLNRPQEWHVATITSWGSERHAANVLLEAFRQRDASGLDVWGQWSTKNPNAAAIFWPLVQQVALRQLYSCIPDLLEIAESTTDSTSLERNVLEAIAKTVVARLERSSEEVQSTELLSWLGTLPVKDPDNARWFEERKKEVQQTRGPLGL